MDREDFFEELFKLRQALAASYLSSRKPIISGHIPLNREILSKFSDYSFFTVIRNPVKRWISDYRFSYSISGMGSFFDKEPPDHPIDGIKRALTSDSGRFQRNIYTIYFSGYGWEPLDESSKTKAKNNMKSIDKIFLTENMSEAEKYIRKNSFINEEVKEEKKTKEKDKKGEELKEELEKNCVQAKIRDALDSDSEIYEAARELSVS